jgi:nucleotide-binding universal stress UspA family protein
LLFNRILLATDLSRESRSAYPHVLAIARKFDASVTLLHVDERHSFGLLGGGELEKYHEALDARIERQLAAERQLFSEHGVEIDLERAAGSPAEVILEVAEREAFDLVVLTRQGGGGTRHFLMGPTTKKLVRHAHLPVLVVPASEAESDESVGDYTQLITTTDFSEDSQRGFQQALAFAKPFGAKTTIVHVVRLPPMVPAILGEPALYLPKSVTEDIESYHHQQLRSMVDDSDGAPVDYWIELDSSTVKGIVRAASTLEADLIVVPSHGKGGLRSVLLGSTSEGVLRQTVLPVLILPRTYLQIEQITEGPS